jgi:hypothetical protein
MTGRKPHDNYEREFRPVGRRALPSTGFYSSSVTEMLERNFSPTATRR